jgi:enterochelin esterase family protein
MPEIVAHVRSAHLQNERQVWIRAPRDPAASQLVVFLDGELYRDRVSANAVIDALGDSIADAWHVFVSVESAESRWRECPCHPPFARFIAEELLPWLGRHTPELAAVRERTLVGLSYTGLAAAFVAKEFPGRFARVISQSGSFWSDDAALVTAYRQLTSPLPTAFHLSVGTREIQTNVQHRPDVLQKISQVEGVRRFRDALRANGHDVTYVEFEGGHECEAWRAALPDALRWALPRI